MYLRDGYRADNGSLVNCERVHERFLRCSFVDRNDCVFDQQLFVFLSDNNDIIRTRSF